jgi:arginine-tRNA-protein transferase
MEAIPYPSGKPAHLPSHYGSYHQLYRLDGRLVGMGVIDILPSCVSSVYFMWEKEYEKFLLGKVGHMGHTRDLQHLNLRHPAQCLA